MSTALGLSYISRKFDAPFLEEVDTYLDEQQPTVVFIGSYGMWG
jgi:hypothetical protein